MGRQVLVAVGTAAAGAALSKLSQDNTFDLWEPVIADAGHLGR